MTFEFFSFHRLVIDRQLLHRPLFRLLFRSLQGPVNSTMELRLRPLHSGRGVWMLRAAVLLAGSLLAECTGSGAVSDGLSAAALPQAQRSSPVKSNEMGFSWVPPTATAHKAGATRGAGSRSPSPGENEEARAAAPTAPLCCAECDAVEQSRINTLGLRSPPPSGRKTQWKFQLELTADKLSTAGTGSSSIQRVASSPFGV